MTLHIDHRYDRRGSPFLALTRGCFEFLHTSTNGTTGVALRQLSVAPLGRVRIHSGRLLVGDPFSMLQHEGNPWFDVPPGEHAVLLTLAAVGEDRELTARQRAAYVSVVFQPEALARRQDLQRDRLLRQEDPALPSMQLEEAPPMPPHGSLSEAETEALRRPGVSVLSGSLALCDAEAFEALMPPNRTDGGNGWFERFFDHGVPGSWFDSMDAGSPLPKGCCNILLPDAENGETIVICPTGWGDGHYPVCEETDDQGNLVALHVDFGVVPYDSMGKPNFR